MDACAVQPAWSIVSECGAVARNSENHVSSVFRAFVVNLQEAIQGRNLRDVASCTGLEVAELQAMLDGNEKPDLRVIALLEIVLCTRLWPEVRL